MAEPPISLRDYIESRFTSHEREHEQNNKALQLAAVLAESNKSEAEKWRNVMSERERSFLPRAEYDAAHLPFLTRLDVLEDKDIARTTRELERERSATRTMALMSLAAAVGGFLLSLIVRLLGIG